MPRDVARLLGATVRQVTTTRKNGEPAIGIVATRPYDTSIDDLWDALTNPERIPRWFTPISGDLELGGRYQLEGNAGGTITECDPPRRFSLTWEMHDKVSWVDVELTPESDARTVLRLEHLGPGPDEFWEQFGPGAGGVGWDLAMFGLEQHFATGEAVRPENAMAWLGSDEGKAFIRASCDAWGDAAVAFGEDPDGARAAAERTRGFYMGEEPGSGES